MLDCKKCGVCCTDQVIPIRPGDVVPVHLQGPCGLFVRREHGRCSALTGRVGIDVACSIYEQRPAVCRALVPGSDPCLKIREAGKLG